MWCIATLSLIHYVLGGRNEQLEMWKFVKDGVMRQRIIQRRTETD